MGVSAGGSAAVWRGIGTRVVPEGLSDDTGSGRGRQEHQPPGGQGDAHCICHPNGLVSVLGPVLHFLSLFFPFSRSFSLSFSSRFLHFPHSASLPHSLTLSPSLSLSPSLILFCDLFLNLSHPLFLSFSHFLFLSILLILPLSLILSLSLSPSLSFSLSYSFGLSLSHFLSLSHPLFLSQSFSLFLLYFLSSALFPTCAEVQMHHGQFWRHEHHRFEGVLNSASSVINTRSADIVNFA